MASVHDWRESRIFLSLSIMRTDGAVWDMFIRAAYESSGRENCAEYGGINGYRRKYVVVRKCIKPE
jgi:hypothetical protein